MAEHGMDQIDAYIRDLFVPADPVLDAALHDMKAGGLPTIQVPPELGRLLAILVRTSGAQRILEIGTLGGYSAIWMARALPPDGHLLSLELDPHHADVARGNLARAGLAERVEIRVGAALELLPTLLAEPPFDMVFIDADKPSYPQYLDWALRLVRPRGLIVGDNTLRGGAVLDPADDGARAIDRFNRAAAANPRLDAIILPNRSGNDGMLIAVVREAA